MAQVMHDPDGDELYLDDNNRPCVRLVEALGMLAHSERGYERVSGAGTYVESWVDGRWQYAAGPFYPTLSGFSGQAIKVAIEVAKSIAASV